MKSDLEIAQSAHLEKIEDVAKKINVTEDALISFGPYMAKINSKEKKVSISLFDFFSCYM